MRVIPPNLASRKGINSVAASTLKDVSCLRLILKDLIQIKIRCKGTTKNAHTQVERANIHKNDRFIYLIHYPSLAQARLKVKCWIVDDKVATDFMTICERTGVWAALSERSYGGIGFDCDGILSGFIKAKAVSEVQQKMHIRKQNMYFCIFWFK